MSLGTDCPPIFHNNSGDEFSICEERTTKRPKVEEEINDHHLGTTSIHQIQIKDTCASCLCDDCANFAVTFSFKYNDGEIELLRKVATHEILHRRKLQLVLNLNHTLLRVAGIDDLTLEEEAYLDTEFTDDPLQQDILIVTVPPKMKSMLLKFRPFVQTFLKEASDMFEMNVYSNSPLSLVREMIQLLDPRNEYFGSRVFSRDDFCSTHPKNKCLDVLLAQESAVLILDHKLEAWREQNQNNVMPMQEYFFCEEEESELRSCCEMETNEGYYLALILQRLKQIHNRFFDDEVICDRLIDRDVRKVLETLRGSVLGGCKIAFDPLQADKLQLWKMAEQLGATCVEQMDASVTHVVAAHAGTPESRWALEEKKFLVYPSWIEASHCMWQKCHEDRFPVFEDDQIGQDHKRDKKKKSKKEEILATLS
ncbi:RNA polymerase II C-terminal domain phosphatase-like 4 [Rosa rugosa]|uniref:RNA polymerase II C-terminal domain phosphatase-like 4 n=1 Tax=Rosa rugosa TaxID=74645 RepID=UPI002B414EA2|nr:RNA polymerase II C-terminal domain phosphatase-like 4 [Rosa rugosa]